jgi:hypothetical protein
LRSMGHCSKCSVCLLTLCHCKHLTFSVWLTVSLPVFCLFRPHVCPSARAFVFIYFPYRYNSYMCHGMQLSAVSVLSCARRTRRCSRCLTESPPLRHGPRPRTAALHTRATLASTQTRPPMRSLSTATSGQTIAS